MAKLAHLNPIRKFPLVEVAFVGPVEEAFFSSGDLVDPANVASGSFTESTLYPVMKRAIRNIGATVKVVVPIPIPFSIAGEATKVALTVFNKLFSAAKALVHNLLRSASKAALLRAIDILAKKRSVLLHAKLDRTYTTQERNTALIRDIFAGVRTKLLLFLRQATATRFTITHMVTIIH